MVETILYSHNDHEINVIWNRFRRIINNVDFSTHIKIYLKNFLPKMHFLLKVQRTHLKNNLIILICNLIL